MTAVFECPECRHICEQTELPVKRTDDSESVLWQCDNCSVIYAEQYRREQEERRRRRRERHQESG